MAISPPKVNITIEPQVVNEIIEDQKVLFVGQMTTGTATADTLVENIGNLNEQDTLFGADSMLAGMVRQAKAYNKNTRMDAIVLADEGGSTAATGTFVITGPATEAGTMTFVVGSRKQFSFVITVADTDTATVIGDALEAAITASTNTPFSAANVTGTVTITAKNKGLSANFFGLETTGTVAGVSVVITAMTGGATDPILTTTFALVDNLRYQTVIFPETYLLQSVAVDFLNDRFNTSTDELLDGQGIATITDTLANFLTNTTAANSQSFTLFGNQKVDETAHRGSALEEINYEISSQFGAVRALRLTEGTNLSEVVVSTLLNKDARGGFHISTLPYHNTPFKNLTVIDNADMWLDDERDQLKAVGFSILGNNTNNKEIIADDIVTRYLTNTAGDSDESFKFLNYVDQATTVRDVFHTTLKSVYAQSRLTEGTLAPGFNMTNAGDIKAELMSIYLFLANNVVVPSGPSAIRTFKNSIQITVIAIDGKVEIEMLDPVVTQLREIDVIMQLTFSLNS